MWSLQGYCEYGCVVDPASEWTYHPFCGSAAVVGKAVNDYTDDDPSCCNTSRVDHWYSQPCSNINAYRKIECVTQEDLYDCISDMGCVKHGTVLSWQTVTGLYTLAGCQEICKSTWQCLGSSEYNDQGILVLDYQCTERFAPCSEPGAYGYWASQEECNQKETSCGE
jgi:hypothetical protein